MKELVGEDLGSLAFLEGHEVIDGFRLEGCTLSASVLARDEAPEVRPLVRNVELVRCRIDGQVFLHGAVVDGCTVDGVRAGDLDLHYCAFRHVRLTGRMSLVNVYSYLDGPVDDRLRRIVAANAELHAEVDWALDIRGLRCRDYRLRNLPVDKLVVDPSYQAVVTPASMARAGEVFPDAEALPGVVGSFIRGHISGHPYIDDVIMVLDRSKDRDGELGGHRLVVAMPTRDLRRRDRRRSITVSTSPWSPTMPTR